SAAQDITVGRLTASDRAVRTGEKRERRAARPVSLRRGSAHAGTVARRRDATTNRAVSAVPNVLWIGGGAVSHDRSLSANAVEVRIPSRVSRDPRRSGTPLSDVLLDGDVAGPCAVLHDGAGRFEDREGFGNRRDHRIRSVRRRCRCPADAGPRARPIARLKPRAPSLARPTHPTHQTYLACSSSLIPPTEAMMPLAS